MKSIDIATTNATVQIFDYCQSELDDINRWALDARCQTLLCALGESQDDKNVQFTSKLLTFLNHNLPEEYAHTYLFLIPWSANSTADEPLTTAFRSLWHNHVLPEPLGTAIVAVYSHQHQLQNEENYPVHLATRNMLTWLPLDRFLRRLSTDADFVGLWGKFRRLNIISLSRSLPVQLTCVLLTESTIKMSLFHDRQFDNNLRSVSGRVFVRLAGEYFNTCSGVLKSLAGDVWAQDDERCASLISFEFPLKMLTTMIPNQYMGYLIMSLLLNGNQIRWGERRYALIVPNWWHWRTKSGVDYTMGFSMRQLQAIFILSASSLLFIGLVLARWRFECNQSQRPRAIDWLLCDTWSRLMAVSVPDDICVGHRRGLAVLATVWGMLNGITMTGVLFELSVNNAWEPVFGQSADVWTHTWLPIYTNEASLHLLGGTRYKSVLS